MSSHIIPFPGLSNAFVANDNFIPVLDGEFDNLDFDPAFSAMDMLDLNELF